MKRHRGIVVLALGVALGAGLGAGWMALLGGIDRGRACLRGRPRD